MDFQTCQPIGVIDHTIRGINIDAYGSWYEVIEDLLFKYQLTIEEVEKIRDEVIPRALEHHRELKGE